MTWLDAILLSLVVAVLALGGACVALRLRAWSLFRRRHPEEAAAYRPGFKWYFDWDGMMTFQSFLDSATLKRLGDAKLDGVRRACGQCQLLFILLALALLPLAIVLAALKGDLP